MEQANAFEEVELDEHQAWIFNSFLELCRARPDSINGPLGIPFVEIKAWSDLTGVTLAAWELGALTQLDSLWLRLSRGRPRRTEPESD